MWHASGEIPPKEHQVTLRTEPTSKQREGRRVEGGDPSLALLAAQDSSKVFWAAQLALEWE